MCIAIVCYPGCDVMDCEINLIFLIEPFFLHDQKVMTKTWIPWERKELLRWNKKSISHHFLRAIIEANIYFFFLGGGRWVSDFKETISQRWILRNDQLAITSDRNFLWNSIKLQGEYIRQIAVEFAGHRYFFAICLTKGPGPNDFTKTLILICFARFWPKWN